MNVFLADTESSSRPTSPTRTDKKSTVFKYLLAKLIASSSSSDESDDDVEMLLAITEALQCYKDKVNNTKRATSTSKKNEKKAKKKKTRPIPNLVNVVNNYTDKEVCFSISTYCLIVINVLFQLFD